jgi:hypothetical protein
MKKLPRLKNDKQAEEFVARSDLTEYDLSRMQRVEFEHVLRKLVVPTYDAMKANPGRGIPIRKAFASIRARHKSRTTTRD